MLSVKEKFNTQTLAAIDVGSNSVRLMVSQAQGSKLTTLKTALITTRLLSGVHDGIMSGDPMRLTAEAVATHVESARALGADRIEVFGTSALRDARNREDFSDRTEKLCGLRVNVISGEEEAQLAYAGAAPKGEACVIDIGGGSTELIAGKDGIALRAHSAQIGAVRLMNLMEAQLDCQTMCRLADERLRETVRIVLTDTPTHFVGVGGTITSLAAMTRGVDKYTPNAVEGYPLTENIVADWMIRLCSMTLEERYALVGLPPARADIIPYGTAILLAFMRASRTHVVLASDHDNLEGYIRRHMLAEST